MTKKVHIMTSGYSYKTFYPKNTSSAKYFSEYIKMLNSVEINYTFYKVPDDNVFKKWYKNSPTKFLFIIKAHQYFTHYKQFNIDKDFEKSFDIFIKKCKLLKNKLGPILFQFSSRFSCTEKNINKLMDFGNLLKYKKYNIDCIFEFRNISMYNDFIYELFKKYKWTIAANDYIDQTILPKLNDYPLFTKNIYIRLHGTKKKYMGKYTKYQLNKINDYIKNNKNNYTIFVCFNNTDEGKPAFAIQNALELKSIINNST
jgi:uncharacterized protein YecE (DUF72 family)